MSTEVLVDTGPLVAILSSRDNQHKTCVDAMKRLRPPLYTCWPVITEAAWLLRQHTSAVQRLLESLADGSWLKLLEMTHADSIPISRIIKRYRKLGAQLADASVLHLAEREQIDTVFTLDRRDFSVYRIAGNQALNLLPQ